jgi:hypothetical protein
MLALGRHGEGSQGGDAVMRVVVREDRRGASRNAGAPAGEPEQQATLIQEGEVGAQTWSFFNRLPRVTLPVGDGLLVALDGTALGYLVTPIPATPLFQTYAGW